MNIIIKPQYVDGSSWLDYLIKKDLIMIENAKFERNYLGQEPTDQEYEDCQDSYTVITVDCTETQKEFIEELGASKFPKYWKPQQEIFFDKSWEEDNPKVCFSENKWYNKNQKNLSEACIDLNDWFLDQKQGNFEIGIDTEEELSLFLDTNEIKKYKSKIYHIKAIDFIKNFNANWDPNNHVKGDYYIDDLANSIENGWNGIPFCTTGLAYFMEGDVDNDFIDTEPKIELLSGHHRYFAIKKLLERKRINDDFIIPVICLKEACSFIDSPQTVDFDGEEYTQNRLIKKFYREVKLGDSFYQVSELLSFFNILSEIFGLDNF